MNVKRVACVTFGLALAGSLAAETWYLKGGGAHRIVNNGKDDWGYDWYAMGENGNWTNALGTVGVPAEGDVVVIPAKNPDTGKDSVTFSASGGSDGSQTKPIDALIAQGKTCLHQGTLVLRAGGAGLSIGGDSTWWSGIKCMAHGEDDSVAQDVVLTVPRGATFQLQKGVVSSGPSFIKAGDGTFVNFCEGDTGYASTDLRDMTVRLRGGSFVNNMSRPATNVCFVFDSDDPNVRLALGRTSKDKYWVWSIENGAIEESDAVQNTEHGITTTHTDLNHYLTICGTPTVNPMRFTGAFYEKAGLVWNPATANAEFVIAKSISPTTGGLLVSNGVVRLSEGATFSKLSRLDVAGTQARFVVDSRAGVAFQAQDVRIADGGKVVVGQGVTISFTAATVNGAALAPGFHTAATAATWLEGDGCVYVAGGETPQPCADTWTGAGADTALTTAANWEGNETTDLTTGGLVATFATGGSRATFVGDSMLRLAGIVFTQPFTLDTAADAKGMLLLGANGISTPVSETAQTYDIGWPIMAIAPQTWTAESNTTVRYTTSVSGLSTSDRIVVDGEGRTEFLAANTFPNDMMLTNGTVRFAGDNAMGAATGTTWGDSDRMLLVFGGGVNVRPLQLFMPSGSKDNRIHFEAGTTNRFEGKVMFGIESGSPYRTMQTAMLLGRDAEVTFAGGLHVHYQGHYITGPAHIIVTNRPLMVRDRFCLYAKDLVYDLWVANNRVSGNSSFWNGGTLRTRVPYALEKNAQGEKSRVQINGADFTLDLCGNDQSMGVLDGREGTITSATPAFFHVAQNHMPQPWDNGNVTNKFNVGITNAVVFTGGAGLSLDAELKDFPHVLTATSSSSGMVQVTSGRLTLAAPNGSWTNATAAVVGGGTLVLEHAQAIGRQTDVLFEGTDGRLELAAGVAQKCRDLYFDGIRQRPGTYGSSQSRAQHKDDARFVGTGVLNVLSDGKGFMLILR